MLWWRSVGYSHTAFVVESFLDEVAHAAGKDPYEFRARCWVPNTRAYGGVLELAAQQAGWGTPLPPGRARGIAAHESFGKWVAEGSLANGRPRVHRVVCAIDCGQYVTRHHPGADGERHRVRALGRAPRRDHPQGGRVQQSNFHDYSVLRMNEMPLVGVRIVESREKPGGVGEPGVPPVAPATGNALFALTGKRIRRLPVQAET